MVCRLRDQVSESRRQATGLEIADQMDGGIVIKLVQQTIQSVHQRAEIQPRLANRKRRQGGFQFALVIAALTYHPDLLISGDDLRRLAAVQLIDDAVGGG